MGLWITRVELEDRCGRLRSLAGAVAGIGASIVDLDIHHLGGDRVADELVLDVPMPVDAPLIGHALERAGVRVLWLRPVDPHQLSDRTVRALDVAADVFGREAEHTDRLGAAAARLIDAELAWVGPVGGCEPPPVAAEALATGTPVRGRLAVKRLPPRPDGRDPWALAVPLEPPGAAPMVVMVIRRDPPFSFTETARVQALLRAVTAWNPSGGGNQQGSGGVVVELDDGGQATVRDLGPDDAGALVRLHARCSDLTRYRRYFTPKPQLGSPVLHRLLDVDGFDRIGLVAAAGTEILGAAHLHRREGATGTGEIAVLVEDGHQRRGIGTALLRRLLQRATTVGIDQMVAVTQPDNDAIARLLRRAATPIRTEMVDGFRHLSIPVTADAIPPCEPPPTGSNRRRLQPSWSEILVRKHLPP